MLIDKNTKVPINYPFRLLDQRSNILTSLNEVSDYRSRQLAAIVESSTDAIISFMLDGTVISWNSGAQQLFGYSIESTIGKGLRQIIGSECDAILDGIKKDKKMDNLEFIHATPDGRLIYLSLSVSAIKDEEGNVSSGAAIFRDITQMKQAESELLRTSQQLAQSNKELEEFAWIAAHDLKEPVRTMGTYSRLLKDEYGPELDEQAQQFLEFIHSAAGKAMARIDDVLKFSAVGREKFIAVPVNLNEVLSSVQEDIQLVIRESKAEIIVEPLPKVSGNFHYLTQLFQNLLANAIKYRSESTTPKIRVYAEKEGGLANIIVQDNGIGFSMEDSTRIFRMFQRLHPETRYAGTGLGLAMCKKIVELHGGIINVESQEGKGSKFIVSLPVASK